MGEKIVSTRAKRRLLSRISIPLLALSLLFMIAISACILYYADGMRSVVVRRTQNYLTDVSSQTTALINDRIQGILSQLRLIADDVAHLSPDEIPELLECKAEIAGFTALTLLSTDDVACFPDGSTLNLSSLSRYPDLQANDGIACSYEDQFVYIVPLPNDSKTSGLIVGFKSMDRMREMIDNECFAGQGSTCILDQDGRMVIPPTQRSFSARIAAEQYEEADEWAVKMVRDLAQGRSGSIRLPVSGEASILLDYRPISIKGWFCVTMIPEDIIMGAADIFASRIFTTTIVIVALYFLLFLALFFIQATYRARVEQVAFTDPLTGGSSSVRFLLEAERTIRHAPQGAFSIVALNIRDFQLVNDIEGAAAGDQLLRCVYRTLEELMERPGEVAARGEADTFYLLLASADEVAMRSRLHSIAAALGTIVTATGPLRVTQGVYPVPTQDADLISCQSRANAARKSAAGGYQSACAFYDSALLSVQREQAEMLRELEQAFDREEFVVYLQPKIRVCDGSLAGAEALVRWIHPEHGCISPARFIPLCEQSGMICRLDLYVFERVCALVDRWQRSTAQAVPLSVNMSRAHFQNLDFLSSYQRILDRFETPAGLVEIELTESIMFSDSETLRALDIINRIHQAGLLCSLDDFGSGYSALNLLQKLPIDALKLDRRFFLDCLENPRARLVIESIVQLAQRLGIITVAEGVEEEAQVDMLREAGCDLIQGYYFSPPLPVCAFEEKYLR